MEKGSIINAKKGSHDSVYQELKMIEQKSEFWGIISAWYCADTSKQYIFLYYDLNLISIKNSKILSKQSSVIQAEAE